MTVIVNLYGGQPVVLPGYQYTSEEACKAALYEMRTIRAENGTSSALVSAICVPVDPNALGLGTGE